MNTNRQLTKKPGSATVVRPLGVYYADVLQRQGMRQDIIYFSINFSERRRVRAAELISESPPNVAFLLEREAAKLRAFADLTPDWDSYGAAAIAPTAISSALELIQQPLFVRLLPYHKPRLAVFPLRNGGVQLDLNGGKAPIEIEVSPTGELEFTLFGPDDEVVWESATLAEAIERYRDFTPATYEEA